MKANKLTAWILTLVCAAAARVTLADAEPVAPKIEPLDQAFLTRVVRRTLEQHVEAGTVYQPTYVPRALAGMQCQIVVTLRQFGYIRGVGSSIRMAAVTAARDAALAALDDAASVGPVTREWLGRIHIETEAIGQPVPLAFAGRWDDPAAFHGLVEPGIDGLALKLGNVSKRFLPSHIISQGIEVYEAAQALAQQLAPSIEQLEGAELFRFRSTHWHELTPGGQVVQLHRGLILIEPDEVTDENLARTIGHIADYMVYRQLPTGWFSYQYKPSNDTYLEDDNLVRQAGVAWGLAVHGRDYDKTATLGASEKALERLASRIVDLPGVPDAAFVAGRKKRHKLGITALTVLAMFDHPNAEKFADKRRRLINGIYWLQRPSGKFVTAFPPTRKLSDQYYFPGEALLALARDYEHQPNQRAVDAFGTAYGFYTKFFRDNPMPPFVPWQAQAFARMALPTKKRAYADYVFEMTDWLLSKQYTPENCPWPELYGGVAAYVNAPPGVATAAYLEGISDALLLARKWGDRERAARYERAVRLAARFVMQLQFRPEEAYYVRSKPDTVWGTRTTLTRNHLRIDHSQHALMALMKSRRLLFGPPS
ncbi:MAG: AMMECR1 domain-containing protein [Phycisphaerae bacterium]